MASQDGNKNIDVLFREQPFLPRQEGRSPQVRTAIRETLTCEDPQEVIQHALYSLKTKFQKFCFALAPVNFHTTIPTQTTLGLSTGHVMEFFLLILAF